MKILRYTRQVLAFIGYLSDKRIFRFKFFHTILSLLLFIILILLELASSFYVVHHLQIGDVQNGLYGALQVTATILLIGGYCTIMYHKDNVRQVIDEFQIISKKCNWISLNTVDSFLINCVHC